MERPGRNLLWLPLVAVCCFSPPTLIAQWVSQPKTRGVVPSVYVDRSHEWLFAYDDLAEMLTTSGFDVFLADCSLEAVTNLPAQRVVVLMNCGTPSTLSAAESDRLLAYARGGGNLLIITKPSTAPAALAASLGCTFLEGASAPLIATPSLVLHGCPREIPARAVNYHLRPPAGSSVLVTDAGQKPVAAALACGRGRVVVWLDDYSFWEFCAQRDRHGRLASAPGAPMAKALFKWLVNGRVARGKGQTLRVEAELVERQESLTIRYSKPIESAARQLSAQIPAVLAVVRKWNRQDLPADPPYTIHCLAGGGGGWAGPHGAGLCVYGGSFPIRVLGHELTHSIANPLPGIFGEGWAIVVGQKAGEALGGAADARTEYESIIRRLDEVDPRRNTLDLMKSEQGPYNHDCQHKAVWLLYECQKKYGEDFMSRVLRLRDQQYGVRKPVTLTQLFRLFAQASKDTAIDNWLRSLGTSLPKAP